jgi:hypothetical protein
MKSSSTTLDATPSPRLLQVLGDIPLQPWQCLAELVDNSLDELLKQQRTPEDPLTVDIQIADEGPGVVHLVVSDNGTGMSLDELEKSIKAGHSGKNRYGSLGLFGMGFNIATARLGNVTTVSTTKFGVSERYTVTIDFHEMQKNETYMVPVEIEPCDEADSGTTVRVHLKRQMADTLKRQQHQETLRTQLGDIYSYLLRKEVPGLSGSGMSSPIPAIVRIQGKEVRPKLPCVWDERRTVTSYGREVEAVQYINRKLTPATACLDCGYWDKKNGPERCEECDSENLELRDRRIWGWIGIQRFIDPQHFGLDFLRYGRKILWENKDIFVYTDADTLESDREYPIEMPANQGRIVGEIHLDHVPVTYQKNDFDRNSYDWQTAVEVIRGGGPLKPRGAREVNGSPLALLYSAFRRNDPGLRYLTPGDGKKALHAKAREWARLFDKGVARMQPDTEWFEAALRHQRIRDGEETGHEDSTTGSSGSAPDSVEDLLGPETRGEEGDGHAGDPKVAPAPLGDIYESARLLGNRREDLSGVFQLGDGLGGSWEITVITTRDILKDSDGRECPSIPGAIKGKELEVFVASEHPIFREYGRDVRDVALMQAASLISGMTKGSASVASVYGALVMEVQDLRETVPSILDRIDRTLERLRSHLAAVVADDPASYWASLSTDAKSSVERAAFVKFSSEPLDVLVEDGRFILCAGAAAISEIVQDRPADFFDGRVFKPSLVHRMPEAQVVTVSKVTGALACIAGFEGDELMRQKHDMQLVQVNLDLLEDQLVSEDLLS